MNITYSVSLLLLVRFNVFCCVFVFDCVVLNGLWKPFLITWAYSVTTQNSRSVSNASNIRMMFSWFSVRRIAISCRRLRMSLALFPCFEMNFSATVCPVCFLRPLYTYCMSFKERGSFVRTMVRSAARFRRIDFRRAVCPRTTQFSYSFSPRNAYCCWKPEDLGWVVISSGRSPLLSENGIPKYFSLFPPQNLTPPHMHPWSQLLIVVFRRKGKSPNTKYT